jgi:predicted TIM-barrel fold metal-dependent hydrolase
MQPLLIVDSQVHIWGPDTPDRRWPPPAHGLKPAPHREVPITAATLLEDMRSAGVDRAILVPPSWEGDRNDIVLEAAKTHPDRFRFAARYDLADPSAEEWISRWRSQVGILALQLTFQTPLFQKPLIDGALDWLWPAAEHAGLPLTIYIPNALAPVIARVAASHPELSIVINHFGLAGTRRDDEAFTDFGNLLALAKHSNVAVKASCLPFYTTQPYPFPNLHDSIRRAYDAFGPKRLFWGTDLSRLPCSYRQGVTLFTEELPWLNSSDKEWIMGRAVCQWLGWNI